MRYHSRINHEREEVSHVNKLASPPCVHTITQNDEWNFLSSHMIISLLTQQCNFSLHEEIPDMPWIMPPVWVTASKSEILTARNLTLHRTQKPVDHSN